MKILILANEMLQIGYASASRIKCYSKALKLTGNEVIVLSPFGFPNSINKNIPKKTELEGGISYEFMGYLHKHPREYKSIIFAGILFISTKFYGYSGLLIYLFLRRSTYDILLVYEFSTFYSFLIRIFSVGRPLVQELCEIPYPITCKNQLFKRRFRELLYFTFVDAFIPISENLKYYINNVRRGFKLIKIPILNDVKEHINSKDITIIKPAIIHAGSMHPEKDFILEQLIAYAGAVDKLEADKKFHFYITGSLGDDGYSIKLKKIIDKYKLSNLVHFIGYLSEEDLTGILFNFDMAIIYKENSEINHFGFPTKLGLYMSAGIIVVITEVGEMQKYIINEWNGFKVKPNHIKLITEILFDYFFDKKKYAFMKENIKKTVEENFSLKNNGVRLTDFFKYELIKK